MDMIGNLLYTERRKKGLEIVDAEQATGIRGVYLNALEQGKYEVLPGEVYVKGFIRNYGNYLGLDGTHLVHLYSESLAPVTTEATVITAPGTTKIDSMKQSSFGKKTISTVAVVLILIISAWGLYAWQKSQSSKAPETSQDISASKQKTAAPSVVPPVTYPAVGTASTGLPTKSRPVVLIARYNDRCWTSVIADGKTLYEGIPKPNETLTWEADQQIVVNFGNAAAVELTLNGQPVGKIGERGDVVVKTFTSQTSTTTPIPSAPPATSLPTLPTVPNASGSRP
ncbi:MAG TPA: RodZ domain-containing protein [Negativicutes bacterium]|nr:RodZ domain-containing protein [Negativicutes bacterium]